MLPLQKGLLKVDLALKSFCKAWGVRREAGSGTAIKFMPYTGRKIPEPVILLFLIWCRVGSDGDATANSRLRASLLTCVDALNGWREIEREISCALVQHIQWEWERERERGSVMNSLCVCVCVIVHVWIRRREREKEWPYLIVLSIRNTFLAKQIWLETLTEITDSVASVLFSNAFFSNKIIDRRRKPKDESECLS